MFRHAAVTTIAASPLQPVVVRPPPSSPRCCSFGTCLAFHSLPYDFLHCKSCFHTGLQQNGSCVDRLSQHFRRDSHLPDMVERKGERVRLYVRGTILGYKRSKSSQYPSTSLMQIEGVHTSEEVNWYLGKRLALLFAFALWSVSLATLAGAAAVAVAPVSTPVAAVPAIAPTPAHAPVPAPKPLTLHEKVVSSLRAAGHYGAIAGLIDSLPTADTVVKAGMTLFAPNDVAFNNVQMNSSEHLLTILGYHTTPKVYSYQGLLTLPSGTKVPSSAPNVVIVVTSSATDSYKLDDSLVVDKDIFVDNTVAVHGIDSILDTEKYNKGAFAPEAAPAPVNPISPIISSPPAPPVSDTPVPPVVDSPEGPGMAPAAPETTDKTPNAASASNASLLSNAAMILLVWFSMF